MARFPLLPIEVSPLQQALENTPKLRAAFLQMEKALKDILEPELLERIRLRTASNNHCEYWQSIQYIALDEQLTEREKVVLELTDHIMAYHGQLPEDLYQKVKMHFTVQEITALFFQIGSKNTANWFLIAMQIK